VIVANFVHLGDELPKHLVLNISRFKKIFPEIPISLVVERSCDVSKVINNIWKIHIYDSADKDFAKVLSSLSHDDSFRDEFWTKTLERIFAFIQFHKTLDSETKLLHIESDVILFPNFPWKELLNPQLQPLGWCAFNSDHDVAALLYSQSPKSSAMLEEYLTRALAENRHLTDMTALNQLTRMYPDLIFYFPSFIEDLNKVDNSMETIWRDKLDPRLTLLEKFNGVFDGAAFGVYLTGIDPRNTFGRKLLHSESNITNSQSYVKPQFWNYSTDINGNLWLKTGSETIPIYCLHIHSKNLMLFEDDWRIELNRLINLPKTKKYDGFSFRVFFTLILENYKNDTLFRYFFSPLRNKLYQISILKRIFARKR
jgi:hypothetical protein